MHSTDDGNYDRDIEDKNVCIVCPEKFHKVLSRSALHNSQFQLFHHLQQAVSSTHHYALAVTEDDQTQYRVELHALHKKFTPLFIDFSRGRIAHRLKFGGGRRQALGRALGLQENKNPLVIDATAGLGRDAIVLANLGCQVLMLERNPVLHSLLDDGIRRLKMDGQINCQLNIELVFANAIEFLPTCKIEHADAIYIDPMYPHRTKSSLVKKEMRIIRDIAGQDSDSDALLVAAQSANAKRIVVKRPIHAEQLSEVCANHSIKSKTTRYDVYINHALLNKPA